MPEKSGPTVIKRVKNGADAGNSPLRAKLWRTLNTTPTDRLSHHVARWMRQWQRTNQAQLDPRIAQTLRSIDGSARRPMWFLVVLFLFSILFASVLTVLGNGHSPIPFLALPPLPTATLDQLETLWAVQATITAVVYPIVLGFIGILMQGRASSKARLNLYLITTGARAAGLSAATLVLFIGIGYLIVSLSDNSWIEPLLIASLYWFVVTAYLTVRFLYKTLDFLVEEHQLRAFEQYAVHLALPAEVRAQLMVHMWRSGQAEGLIPGEPSWAGLRPGRSPDSDPEPKINLLGWDHGEECDRVQLRRPRRVVDVRLRLLRWGLLLWLRQARRHLDGAQGSDDWQQTVLQVRITPGAILDGEQALLTVQNGPCPGWLSRFLVRRAFVLSAAPVVAEHHTTAEILRELVDELRAATVTGSAALIEQRLLAVTHVHAALLDHGALRDEAGSEANVALIQDVNRFTGGSLNRVWVTEYRPWIEDCVGQLGQRDEGFAKACHLSQRMIWDVPADPLKVSIELLGLHLALFADLARWWSRQAEEQGQVVQDAPLGVMLGPPLLRRYQQALELAIGTWEQIRLPVGARPNPRTQEAAWAQVARQGRFVRCTLQQTAGQLIKAVARNDPQAARLFANSFVTWPSREAYRFQHRLAFIGGIPHFLTAAALDQPWSLAWRRV